MGATLHGGHYIVAQVRAQRGEDRVRGEQHPLQLVVFVVYLDVYQQALERGEQGGVCLLLRRVAHVYLAVLLAQILF